ncbi:hypothetical protein [Streptomyces sp. C10]|uniref:hypothetical protein n=1 Tax=Streptomyces sp. C10 TaxID=531941 RepID=UPI00397FE27A
MTAPPAAGGSRAPHPTALAAVVPAHNEAQELPGALDAVRAAARHPALADLPVVTVVVADACTDAPPSLPNGAPPSSSCRTATWARHGRPESRTPCICSARTAIAPGS